MMRKAIAWPVAWTLFWFGHLISRCLLHHDWTFTHAAFNTYQWAMGASLDLQDWAGLAGPWEPVEVGDGRS